MKKRWGNWGGALMVLALLALSGRAFNQAGEPKVFPEPRIPFAPPHYICYRTLASLQIDGKLDEPAW